MRLLSGIFTPWQTSKFILLSDVLMTTVIDYNLVFILLSRLLKIIIFDLLFVAVSRKTHIKGIWSLGWAVVSRSTALAVVNNLLLECKGSRPYPSDNAKRQFDVMGGWVGFKRGPLMLCCDKMYTFSSYRIKVDH